MLHYDSTTSDFLDFLILCRGVVSTFYDDSMIFDGRTDTSTSPYILQFQTSARRLSRDWWSSHQSLKQLLMDVPHLEDVGSFKQEPRSHGFWNLPLQHFSFALYLNFPAWLMISSHTPSDSIELYQIYLDISDQKQTIVIQTWPCFALALLRVGQTFTADRVRYRYPCFA